MKCGTYDRTHFTKQRVRYDGWQDNPEGDREVKKVLRQILWLRYKVRDEDIFAKAHGYIREYY